VTDPWASEHGYGGRVDSATLPAGYDLRTASPEAATALAAAYARNREHLAPWEPVRDDDFFTRAGQEDRLAHLQRDVEAGSAVAWLLHHGDAVVGRVTLSNVTGGVFQSANLGYWVDVDHTGRGLATALVRFAAQQATDRGLHRLEAGVQRANVASQAVLARCGFELIGTAPSYLFLAGRWQDHDLWQQILHDRAPETHR
jgi:ribosomal-protein-alanine N-acetyltransferase